MLNIVALDVLRGVHLVFVAAGMGLALYFDMRSFLRITRPMTKAFFVDLRRIHSVISIACVGLWLSGLALIGVRTGFDLSAFSPKLWSKVIVVSILTVNALLLSAFVIPKLATFQGHRLIDIPIRALAPMTLCAGVSFGSWVLALALGSSAFLKTAGWDILVPVLAGSGAIFIGAAFFVIFKIRALAPDRGAILPAQ